MANIVDLCLNKTRYEFLKKCIRILRTNFPTPQYKDYDVEYSMDEIIPEGYREKRYFYSIVFIYDQENNIRVSNLKMLFNTLQIDNNLVKLLRKYDATFWEQGIYIYSESYEKTLMNLHDLYRYIINNDKLKYLE